MPIYLVTDTETNAERLVEAPRPASATNYVVGKRFTTEAVADRELIAAAGRCELETTEMPTAKAEPVKAGDGDGENNVTDDDQADRQGQVADE